jgi:hypothetical protein
VLNSQALHLKVTSIDGEGEEGEGEEGSTCTAALAFDMASRD